ncbi:hypothetical protein JO972_16340 [Verrucomicrobiaceae bacterium 5K15]|uniref:Uncharacterized protein n=1 Tax=Oceaniferula flava TaxID=2800421 RepID=A0AAE2SH98_9BACT|nr:hypothetical protein [Oceaniferula flavus]MBK1856540.1 hypothetical protein [Oceaniferula flavus]MBM1137847.1 hypothetical protein [Oceaniferula flavus]
MEISFKSFFSKSHIVLLGLALAYFVSQGLRGYTIALAFMMSSLLIVRSPSSKFWPSQARSFYFVGIIIIFMLISCILQYVFFDNRTILMFCFPFFSAFYLGVVLLYFRGGKVWGEDFLWFIISFVICVLIFNLLITVEIPRDEILKESFGATKRGLVLDKGDDTFLGVFVVHNLIAIPYGAAIGLALCGAAVCIKKQIHKFAVFLLGLAALFPAYYTQTRAPYIVFAIVMLILCSVSMIQRKNLLLVATVFMCGFVGVIISFTLNVGILSRFADLSEGDGRFTLWQDATANLFGFGEFSSVSDYAHNYVLDVGMDHGRVLALLALVICISILYFCFLMMSKLDKLDFEKSFLAFFLFVGVVLSMINPPSNLSHMIYGFGLASLPYMKLVLRRLARYERPPAVVIRRGAY